MMNNKVKNLFSLHMVLLLYAVAMLFSKRAATFPFLSKNFILYYGIMLIIMGVYAILWQQILKKTSLNIAFANKAITVIWGMVFGFILFQERIKFSMIIGGSLIIIGIFSMVKDVE